MSDVVVQWSRERWPHERGYGSDSGWVATYKGHELSIRENGGPYVYVDGEPLPRNDGHEGEKRVQNVNDGKEYAQAWVDGKIEMPAEGTLLAPEFGFGHYTTATMVAVSRVVNGKFEVQIEDPREPYGKRVSKIFREGEDPTSWINREVGKHMRKWLKKNHKPPATTPTTSRKTRTPRGDHHY